MKKYLLIICTNLSLLLLVSCREQTPKTSIIVIENQYNSLQEYINLFPNKLIYIDIWASWCGPCLTEIPSSLSLQNQYAEKDIIFLFISLDANPKRWKSTINAKSITGTHIRANNNIKDELEEKYQLQDIPRYMMFGREGNLITSDAPAPSESHLKTIVNNKL